MKWSVYWTALVGALLGVLWLKNSHTHKDKTTQWNLGKSIIECILLVLAVAFMPAIIAIYGSMWITKGIKRPGIKILVGFSVGTVLMIVMGWALEILVLVGVFSIDVLSDDFLSFMKERREQKKGIPREAMAQG